MLLYFILSRIFGAAFNTIPRSTDYVHPKGSDLRWTSVWLALLFLIKDPIYFEINGQWLVYFFVFGDKNINYNWLFRKYTGNKKWNAAQKNKSRVRFIEERKMILLSNQLLSMACRTTSWGTDTVSSTVGKNIYPEGIYLNTVIEPHSYSSIVPMGFCNCWKVFHYTRCGKQTSKTTPNNLYIFIISVP